MTNSSRFTLHASRLIVGITGASGSLYAKRLIETIPANIEVHLVVSENGEKVATYELGKNWLPKRKLIRHQINDFFAPIASGSFKTMGMVVVPCSVGTLGSIAGGLSQNLLQRAADVCLKEGRKLVLVPRETPYSVIHLGNMHALALAGATILDANPGFYQRPKSIDDLVNFVVGRILDHFDLPQRLHKAWKDASH